jgi:DNA-binding XRE family transcriptional regulator
VPGTVAWTLHERHVLFGHLAWRSAETHDPVVVDWPDDAARRIAPWHDWSRLRSERFGAGLNQEELAAAVGANRQTISSLERARSTPSLALACSLARALDMTLDELFAGDELR